MGEESLRDARLNSLTPPTLPPIQHPPPHVLCNGHQLLPFVSWPLRGCQRPLEDCTHPYRHSTSSPARPPEWGVCGAGLGRVLVERRGVGWVLVRADQGVVGVWIMVWVSFGILVSGWDEAPTVGLASTKTRRSRPLPHKRAAHRLRPTFKPPKGQPLRDNLPGRAKNVCQGVMHLN
ncbi:hypothetical protein E2C01_023380 [Portunus trituberculatus]|uniref:Uncharacterized protein n=1 Tax=Portunus trituberculatus TaxID=210409 RepID=A0A5B7E7U6_PORTR|nr:hypothetical protein [Portunus trituberculatus]